MVVKRKFCIKWRDRTCGLLFIATKYTCALCAFSWYEKDFDCKNAQC